MLENQSLKSNGNEIICDTNIWYDIGGGSISLSGHRNLKLNASMLNLMELVSSKRMIENPVHFKKSVEALINNSNQLIKEDPIQHIIKLVKPSFSMDLSSFESLFKEFKKVYDFSESEMVLGAENKKSIVLNEIEDWDSPLKLSVDFIKLKASEIKDKIAFTVGNKQHMQVSAHNHIKCLIIEMVNQSGLVNDLDWGKFNWDKLELMLEIWEQFFKKLETGGMTFTLNDWYDLFYFAYVRPGQKYWTMEKKWVNLMKESQIAHRYLYLLN